VLPGRLAVLIGAGGAGPARLAAFAPAKRWDPGENIVSPYLWSRRVKRLEVAVIPSGNLDGFESILQNFAVAEIWYPAILAAQPNNDSTSVAWQRLWEEARRRGTAEREVRPGESLRLGSTLFEVFGLPSGTRGGASAGDPPLSFRIVNHEGSALVAEGLSGPAAQPLLHAGVDVRSLVFATDGETMTSAASDLLQKVAPRIVVVAPGSGPRENPSVAAVPQPEASSIHFLRTDLQGATTVEMRGSLFAVWTFRGGRLVLP
ncbi:MAG TPA: hypothetical protein VI455_03095, partial [Terriglobia bacterium]